MFAIRDNSCIRFLWDGYDLKSKIQNQTFTIVHLTALLPGEDEKYACSQRGRHGYIAVL